MRPLGESARSRGQGGNWLGSRGPLVHRSRFAQSAERVLDGRILGEVALFSGVFGEVIQLFAAFHFAAQVGPF